MVSKEKTEVKDKLAKGRQRNVKRGAKSRRKRSTQKSGRGGET